MIVCIYGYKFIEFVGLSHKFHLCSPPRLNVKPLFLLIKYNKTHTPKTTENTLPNFLYLFLKMQNVTSIGQNNLYNLIF